MLIRDLDYHVDVLGAGQPLLLLHGFTGSSASWQPLLADLATSTARPEQTPHTPHPIPNGHKLSTSSYGVLSVRMQKAVLRSALCALPLGITPHTSSQRSIRRLILVDLPGHGQSATPPTPQRCTLPEVVADLRQILCELDAVPADVLGYSLGGRLALALALEAPELVQRLIVESGSPGLEDVAERAARRASDEALAARIERDGIERFVAEWERLPLWQSQQTLSDEVRLRQRALRLANRPEGLASSLRGMGTGAQPSYWHALEKLSAPTLLLTGALDAKFEAIARAMCVRNPAFRHLSIAGAGHTPHLEQPAAFTDAVQEFLT